MKILLSIVGILWAITVFAADDERIMLSPLESFKRTQDVMLQNRQYDSDRTLTTQETLFSTPPIEDERQMLTSLQAWQQYQENVMSQPVTHYAQPASEYASAAYAAPVYYYYAPVEYAAPAYYAPMPNYQAQYAAYQHAQQAQWAAIQQQQAVVSAAQFAVETQPADTPPVKPVKKRALSVSVVGRSAGQLAALIVAPSIQQSPSALSATQASSAPAAVNEPTGDAAAKAAHERRLAMLSVQTEQARQEVVRWLGYSIAFSSVAIGVSLYMIAHAASGNSTP